MILPLGDTSSLSLLYHLNTEPWQNLEAYEAAYEVDYKQHASTGDGVPLPALGTSPLYELLRQRCSCRSFERRPLPLADLGALLGGAYGVARTGQLPGVPSLLLRTAPSAGGLYPLELYAMVQEIGDLPDGLHHYNVREHSLEPVRLGAPWTDLRECLMTYEFVASANVVVFLAAVFARTQKKYGPRGYRYVLLEAGHTAQNLCLMAAERGLGSLCMGGFIDTSLYRFLDLEPRCEGAVYAVGVGHPRAE
jgi:SagB-type dehydrogenase family enzyme